ncbi:MAG TPA: Crp/Fnr family transcriptional regulator [Candidatus Limnocylindria bacterium]
MATALLVSALDENRILRALPEQDRRDLASKFEPYVLEHEILVKPGGTIAMAYFPSEGLISVVAALKDGRRAEVATVGCEGMTGLPLVLGSGTSLYEIVSQVAGHGLRIRAAWLIDEVERRPAFKTRLLRYAEARMAMLGQTAACNAAHRITERLARWLLISHDSVSGDTFVLTHEFLSHMLAAERPSVTVAAGTLQKSGAIAYRRGQVRIKDRAQLERAACECYQIVRREVDRLVDGNGTV